VRLGAGSIVLHKADGSVVESFSAASPAARVQLAFNVLTLVPSQPLARPTGYYVTVDANAITDPSRQRLCRHRRRDHAELHHQRAARNWLPATSSSWARTPRRRRLCLRAAQADVTRARR
jgi:hypothetical protein